MDIFFRKKKEKAKQRLQVSAKFWENGIILRNIARERHLLMATVQIYRESYNKSVVTGVIQLLSNFSDAGFSGGT